MIGADQPRDNKAMNAEWPTTRFEMEDQPRPPGYRKRYVAQNSVTHKELNATSS